VPSGFFPNFEKWSNEMADIDAQRHRAAWLGCSALVLSIVACASDKKPALDAAQISPVASEEPAASQQVGDGGTTIRLSPEIMTDCRFPANPEEVPQFDVDEATLRPRGRDILADVASCMKDGPLKNRTVTIVGRADQRGTEDHNHALGANRAEATRAYLVQKGVAENKLLVVSRGEEGATGTDADSMSRDRRVDLVLGDATDRASLTDNPPANATKPSPSSGASTYADQVEGGAASGKATGSSGPGTAAK
jgi:peptidoglycan-associated lipoprotein